MMATWPFFLALAVLMVIFMVIGKDDQFWGDDE